MDEFREVQAHGNVEPLSVEGRELLLELALLAPLGADALAVLVAVVITVHHESCNGNLGTIDRSSKRYAIESWCQLEPSLAHS